MGHNKYFFFSDCVTIGIRSRILNMEKPDVESKVDYLLFIMCRGETTLCYKCRECPSNEYRVDDSSVVGWRHSTIYNDSFLPVLRLEKQV